METPRCRRVQSARSQPACSPASSLLFVFLVFVLLFFRNWCHEGDAFESAHLTAWVLHGQFREAPGTDLGVVTSATDELDGMFVCATDDAVIIRQEATRKKLATAGTHAVLPLIEKRQTAMRAEINKLRCTLQRCDEFLQADLLLLLTRV